MRRLPGESLAVRTRLISARIPVTMAGELADEAERQGTTPSEVVRLAIRAYLNRAAGYRIHDLQAEVAVRDRRIATAEPLLADGPVPRARAAKRGRLDRA